MTRSTPDILDVLGHTRRRTRDIRSEAFPLRRQPYLGYNTSWRAIAWAAGWSTGPALGMRAQATPPQALQWRCLADQVVFAGRGVASASATQTLGLLPRDITPPEMYRGWASLYDPDAKTAVMTEVRFNTDGSITVRDIPTGNVQLQMHGLSYSLPVEGGG